MSAAPHIPTITLGDTHRPFCPHLSLGRFHLAKIALVLAACSLAQTSSAAISPTFSQHSDAIGTGLIIRVEKRPERSTADFVATRLLRAFKAVSRVNFKGSEKAELKPESRHLPSDTKSEQSGARKQVPLKESRLHTAKPATRVA